MEKLMLKEQLDRIFMQLLNRVMEYHSDGEIDVFSTVMSQNS